MGQKRCQAQFFKIKKTVPGTVFLFTALVFLSAIATADMPEPPRAMWVWDAKVIEDDEATEALLDFCDAKTIDLLFISAYNVKGAMKPVYSAFNAKAHDRGISVHAVAGDPRWGMNRYHDRAMEWAMGVVNFNMTVWGNERFDGLHSNVEPYLYKNAWEEDKYKCLREYLDMNEMIMGLVDTFENSLEFFADIPFWFDDDPEMEVKWKERRAPASYHLLDTIDSVVIMDYRNFAVGENGSIRLARKELDYAAELGKKVYIGQETKKDLQPPYITFSGKTTEYMEGEIKKLVNAYIEHPGFAGIAIHHYVSYKKLLRTNR